MPDWRERWQARYRDGPWLFGRDPSAWLAGLDPILPREGRALSLGEGEGRNAVWLARRGLSVTAVDFAPTALARAGALAAESCVRLTLIEADVTRWQPPAGAFDLVILIFLQLTPDERVAAHRAARSALAPGGLLVLEAFAPGPWRDCGPKTDDARYDPAVLEEDFRGLDILELMTGRAVLEEGAGHRGEASVVRLLARRPPLDGTGPVPTWAAWTATDPSPR
ncbi:MAG: class I SAM-dependent methyltransferase [Elioraea sp.]|nr:class I SAM-dependent methyltransferase [Elioraea sp.]